MRLVCDTSVLIDHLRGHRPAMELLARRLADGDDLWSATICRAEVVAGMRSAERRATFALLDALQWVELDAELADRAGALARSYRRSHPGVEIADYLVA